MKKLILFELRKVFSKRLSLIVLVGILLFSVLISFSTYQNKYAFDGVSAEGSGKTAVEIDKEIAAKYEGILTDEKVQQMMNDLRRPILFMSRPIWTSMNITRPRA